MNLNINGRMRKDFEAKMSQHLVKSEAKMRQKLVESEAKIRQKLVESEVEIMQFGSYNVLIIQDNRHRNLKHCNKIIKKNKEFMIST